ncbi:hypothetical protein B0G76_8167 [Paraburkholderia sp. BL23I1N1]|uniref:hypothetical protein n=1 Tax=Paraburkholderia sp. BL23I1N1 TaxID=1938802 RepID=UPI000FEF08EA|nr:hypothetical protein [Paraburkholderia sp. BL23I1N1]RKE24289.1 hypothetical protein B0G76_8167 [Paraburkholderia sp. BL23I1N1]
MATTLNPVYLIGGSKGGVGKSIVALALADHPQWRDATARSGLGPRPPGTPSVLAAFFWNADLRNDGSGHSVGRDSAQPAGCGEASSRCRVRQKHSAN